MASIRRFAPTRPALDEKCPVAKWWLNHFTAAKRLAGKLRKLGGKRIVPPETFHVVGREGPLYEGEIERARVWAASILARLRQSAA